MPKRRMARKLKKQRDQGSYAQRKANREPVNGQIKEHAGVCDAFSLKGESKKRDWRR